MTSERAPESSPTSGQELFPDSRPEIAGDDWEDQDLLTRDEGVLRLENSAALIRAQLESAADDPAEVAGLRKQLDNIARALANLRRST
jgi:hypothetical protein